MVALRRLAYDLAAWGCRSLGVDLGWRFPLGRAVDRDLVVFVDLCPWSPPSKELAGALRETRAMWGITSEVVAGYRVDFVAHRFTRKRTATARTGDGEVTTFTYDEVLLGSFSDDLGLIRVTLEPHATGTWFGTLCHEMAHFYLTHVNPIDEGDGDHATTWVWHLVELWESLTIGLRQYPSTLLPGSKPHQHRPVGAA